MTTKARVWIVALLAIALAWGSLLLVWRAWSREPTRAGWVVEYHVVDDNTAFLLWSVEEKRAQPSGWLSRIDAAGRTIWLRKLPAVPSLGDALRVGNGVLGVRYSSSDQDGVKDHSIAAYSFAGKPLWQRELAPYYPERTEHGPTLPDPRLVGGAAVGEQFLEWAETGKQLTLIGVDQRTGTASFSQPIRVPPSHVHGFFGRAVWLEEPSELLRMQNPGRPALASVRAIDLKTGSIQQATIVGRGCVLDNEYVAVVSRAETRALVAFRDGDLSSPRVIAEPFDPLGNGHEFSVTSCGRYNGQLVFMVETLRDTNPAAFVTITDKHGASRRAQSIEFDILDGPAGELPSRFAEHAPLQGELARFVPIIVPQPAPAVRSEVVVLDLDTLTIARRAALPSVAGHALFRKAMRSYVSEISSGKSLGVTVFDASTGRSTTAIRAFATGENGILSNPLLPTHVGPQTVWLIAYDKATITEPPVTILDGTSLAPVHTSPRISIWPHKTP
jgi:hypothetical protein